MTSSTPIKNNADDESADHDDDDDDDDGHDDDEVANGGSDGSKGLVSETTDLQPITRIQAHSTYITRCLFSPDGKKLATASADHTIKIWDTSTFLLDKTLTGHQRWVWDCVFSADSAYMISCKKNVEGDRCHVYIFVY